MSDINSEIIRLQKAKSDIKSAIEAKNVTVGNGTIDTYAEKISQIATGATRKLTVYTYNPSRIPSIPGSKFIIGFVPTIIKSDSGSNTYFKLDIWEDDSQFGYYSSSCYIPDGIKLDTSNLCDISPDNSMYMLVYSTTATGANSNHDFGTLIKKCLYRSENAFGYVELPTEGDVNIVVDMSSNNTYPYIFNFIIKRDGATTSQEYLIETQSSMYSIPIHNLPSGVGVVSGTIVGSSDSTMCNIILSTDADITSFNFDLGVELLTKSVTATCHSSNGNFVVTLDLENHIINCSFSNITDTTIGTCVLK